MTTLSYSNSFRPSLLGVAPSSSERHQEPSELAPASSELSRQGSTDTVLLDEDEEHTLTAYGDISLSKEGFLPGLPSTLSLERSRGESVFFSGSPSRTLVVARTDTCPPTPSTPSSDFAALPNHDALVARIRKLKEGGMQWKTEKSPNAKSKDDRSGSSFTRGVSPVPKSPARTRPVAPRHLRAESGIYSGSGEAIYLYRPGAGTRLKFV